MLLACSGQILWWRKGAARFGRGSSGQSIIFSREVVWKLSCRNFLLSAVHVKPTRPPLHGRLDHWRQHLQRNLSAAFNQGLSQTPTTMESARTAGCRPCSNTDGSSSSCPSRFRGQWDTHSTQTDSSKSASRSSVGTVPTFLGVCADTCGFFQRPTQTAELEGAQRSVGWNAFVTKWQSECTTQVQHLRQAVAQSQLEAKLRSPAPKRSASGLHDATPELEGWLFRKHCEPPGSPGIRRHQHSCWNCRAKRQRG